MRRPLDNNAIDSMSDTGSQATPKLRRKVSFSLLEDAIYQEEKAPPRLRKDLPRIGEQRPASTGAEEKVRHNLQRLVANHKGVADTWTAVCGCHRSLASCSCFSEHVPCHFPQFAGIAGDIMFIGREPGRAEDALILSGADVRVDGATVAISNEGMPTVFQTLAGPKEAKRWALQVREAADLWRDTREQLEELAEAALDANEESNADTGGTCQAKRSWVELKTRSDLVDRADKTSDVNASSNWSWMLSFLQNTPAVTVH